MNIRILTILFFIICFLLTGCNNIRHSDALKSLPEINLPEFRPDSLLFYAHVTNDMSYNWQMISHGNLTECQIYNCTGNDVDYRLDDMALVEIFSDLSNYKDMANSCSKTENITTYDCLLIYAMYSQRSDLCDHYPVSETTDDCSGSGPCGPVTFYYRDMCKAHVRLFKDYLESSDKYAYCNTLNISSAANLCMQFIS